MSTSYNPDPDTWERDRAQHDADLLSNDVTVEADENLVIEFTDGTRLDFGMTPAALLQAHKDDERATLRMLLEAHGLPTDDVEGDADAGADNPGWGKLTDAMFGTAWRGEPGEAPVPEDHPNPQGTDQDHGGAMTYNGHPLIAVTTDGDTLWLQCFEDDPDAEHGIVICPVEPGDKWFDLAPKVDAHIIDHGC